MAEKGEDLTMTIRSLATVLLGTLFTLSYLTPAAARLHKESSSESRSLKKLKSSKAAKKHYRKRREAEDDDDDEDDHPRRRAKKKLTRTARHHHERHLELSVGAPPRKPMLPDPVSLPEGALIEIPELSADPLYHGTIVERIIRIPEVDEYLCQAYQRMPVKIDSSGDFTWKDYAAAARRHFNVCDYVIGGIHPDLREALYALGKKADERGIIWTFLSGFRDNYRQHIASGYKASDCGSWHGGSCRTRGHGDGRAADLWTTSKYPTELFALIDEIGRELGIHRPMPNRDPGHVQFVPDRWRSAASLLRRERLREMSRALSYSAP